MTGNAKWFVGLACAVAVFLPACDKAVIAPPEIHWGVQECAACSMAIHDERAACALVRIDNDGRLESLACDDVNCLVELLDERPVAGPWTIFVRDRDDLGWLESKDAYFVRSSLIKTPMASCVGAFKSSQAAQAAVADAKVMDFAQTADSIREKSMMR